MAKRSKKAALPELKFQPVDKFTPHPSNPKKHDIDGIKAAIKKYGPQYPIIVHKETGYIIKGHGTLEAYRALGYTSIPYQEISCGDGEARAFLVLDNQLTIKGGYDNEKLADILKDLRNKGLDELTGFEVNEINEICRDDMFCGDDVADVAALDAAVDAMVIPPVVDDIKSPIVKAIEGERRDRRHTCPECGFEF